MKQKIKISKKLLRHLAILFGIVGITILLDVYFDNNQMELNEIEDQSKSTANDFSAIYIVYQANNHGPKTSVQKIPDRKLFIRFHDKFLQQHYQLRNYLALTAKTQTQITPFLLSHRCMIFKKYYFAAQDDDPFIS